MLVAAVANAALGGYLVWLGKRTRSIILEANGKHVLTDSWTSFGVVAGLGLVLSTGWKPFDPIVAIAVALNILWSGGGLLRRSISGLMDYSDPNVARELEPHVEALSRELGIHFHQVRFRHTGPAGARRHARAVSLSRRRWGRPTGWPRRSRSNCRGWVPFDVEVATHIEVARGPRGRPQGRRALSVGATRVAGFRLP